MRGLKLILIAGLIGALAVGGVVLAYMGFARAASLEIRRAGLARTDHNALKHAYAAAETYSALRPLLGAALSERLAVLMGEGNERMEKYLKHDPDWSRESYKDMRNNLTGMVAAEWLYRRAGWTWPATRLRLIGALAADGVLVPRDTDPRLADVPDVRDPEEAITRMRADHDALRRDLEAEIRARDDDLRRTLGLAPDR